MIKRIALAMLVALIVLSSFSGVAETAENDADASVLAIVTDKYKQEARDLMPAIVATILGALLRSRLAAVA